MGRHGVVQPRVYTFVPGFRPFRLDHEVVQTSIHRDCSCRSIRDDRDCAEAAIHAGPNAGQRGRHAGLRAWNIISGRGLALCALWYHPCMVVELSAASPPLARARWNLVITRTGQTPANLLS